MDAVTHQALQFRFKVVKLEGEFVWHKHSDTDETFIVLDGELRIDYRDGSSGDGSTSERTVVDDQWI